MRLLILYGSQTGTAQDVAEQIWRQSKLYGFSGPVLPLDDYPVEQLIEERLAVFVVATTGNGDEPDNMRKTWKFLLRRSLPRDSLSQLQFGCLGLGDSSYAKFNYAAKKLSKRLKHLGAIELKSIGLCDDQHEHGLSAVSLPWTKDLLAHLSRKFTALKAENINLTPIFKWRLEVLGQSEDLDTKELQKLCWSYKQRPMELVLKTNERTTAENHFQDVRLMQFGIPEGTLWNAGDIVEVRPYNSDEDVKTFFELVSEHKLDFTATTVVQLHAVYSDMPVPLPYANAVSVGKLVKYVWDLNHRPRQRAFELLAINCEDDLEKEKLIEFTTSEGLGDLIAYINRPRRTLLEVLQDFPNATSKLTLQILCELFPIIQTRSFSIASMPESNAGTLDLLVAVVNYKTKLSTPRLGLCSNWLKSLPIGSTIFGTLKAGTMSIPRKLQTPLIMIGPGTGIAPFRSIIQSRENEKKQTNTNLGPMIVFFGCRNRRRDFHFEKDFERWEREKLIKGFYAFSRDQEDKIYVQHLIKENCNLLRTLIRDEGAVIFVAGSSTNMPKAVREAFVEVLDGNESAVEELVKLKRYQEETWS